MSLWWYLSKNLKYVFSVKIYFIEDKSLNWIKSPPILYLMFSKVDFTTSKILSLTRFDCFTISFRENFTYFSIIYWQLLYKREVILLISGDLPNFTWFNHWISFRSLAIESRTLFYCSFNYLRTDIRNLDHVSSMLVMISSEIFNSLIGSTFSIQILSEIKPLSWAGSRFSVYSLDDGSIISYFLCLDMKWELSINKFIRFSI